MWYPAKITQAATAEPVTLAEAKAQCGVTSDADNSRITALIAAARDDVERYCAIRLGTQTVEIRCDGFDDFAHVPEVPVQSITAIAYLDLAGAELTLASAVYELRSDGLEAAIIPKSGQVWPVIQPGSRVTVTAVVGFDVPPPAVKAAVLLQTARLYRQGGDASSLKRETVQGVGTQEWHDPAIAAQAVDATVERLLSNYRVFLR